MRTRVWTTPAVAAASLVLALAAPASASEAASASTVEWSSEFETAAAAGQRWTEPGSSTITRDLVLSGTLSNTGDNCYSVWTRFMFDFVPGPTRKQAQICGPGTVDVTTRQAYQPTTTGYLTVCKGTENTSQCAPWESITWWPINQN
jgi:hypothetical protein